MPSFSLEDAAAGKLAEHLSKTITEGMRRGRLSAGMRIVQLIKTVLIPAENPQPVDTGAYRAAWSVSSDGEYVYNDLPYAPVIENGARAENVKIGRAMIDALAMWVVRKGLVSRGRSSIRKAAESDEAQSMAWAIAKSMQKRGIFNRGGSEGLRIAEKARARVPAILAEEIRAEIEGGGG